MRRSLFLNLSLVGLSSLMSASTPPLRSCNVEIAMSDGEQIPSKLRVRLFKGSERISEAPVPRSGKTVLQGLAPGDYRIQTGGAGANFLSTGPVHVPQEGGCEFGITIAGHTEHTGVLEDEVDVEDLRASGRVRALFHSAFAEIEHGELQKAKEAFLEVVKLNPKLARTFNVLGVICEQQGDSAAARQYFEKGLELNPRSSVAVMNLAKLSLTERKFEATLALLERYRIGSRDIADVHAISAETYLKMGRYSESIREAKATHNLPHQGWSGVHVIAAAAFEAMHEPEQAISEYRQYIKECADSSLQQRAAQRIREITALASQQSAPIPMNSLLSH